MSSAITVKGKIDSVGDCGTDRIMAWAAAYNMGQSWVKKAIAKNGGNCNDWPNETWYKLKEVSDESNGELTAAKIANKKGDFTNTSSDYVAKINNQYLAYKGSGIESGDTKIANNSGENNPIEDCGEIMLVGDSLTEGYSKYFDDSCPGVEVCAESGKSTTWMVENCFTDEKLADKKYVVIMGGVNNINTPDKVKSDLALMYSKANQKGIKVLALTIMPWKGYGGWTEEEQQYTENVNAWIKQANISGAVLDTYGLFNNGSDELNENYATDGKLHLNDQGNTVLASQVSGALISIGATGQTQPA